MKVGIKGMSKFDELIVTFKKEHDGTYTKQTKKLTRDRLTNACKYYKKNNPIIEEGPYTRVNAGVAYDEKIEFEDFHGQKSFLYFKSCPPA